MQSNYRKLGPLIKPVNNRDRDETVTLLLGVSIQKKFIPSIANTIGTDMSTYKIIQRNQFAYGPVTSRNGDRISIALLEDYDEAIVSQAYTCFTVKDEAELLPQYLMMWFRRPEFDRYARFMSHGSAREIFSWDELCNTELPVPSPEKQREIVAEYHTIQNRIFLNNQLIQTLETTAQAIYKQWFVEFEFPNEVGQPYKSSGGEMVDSELGEIPKGWDVKPFTKIVKLNGGGTPSTNHPEYWDGSVPFYTPGDLNKSYYSIKTEKSITSLGLSKCSSKLYPRDTIFVTARGATVGGIGMAGIPMAMNQTCYALSSEKENHFFAHQLTMQVVSKLKNEAIGATFEALVTKDFEAKKAVQPPGEIASAFNHKIKPLYDFNLSKTLQNQSLGELANLLLSKLATIETAPSVPKPAAIKPAQLTLSFT